MSRPLRMACADTVYHVYQRGNNKAFIYRSDSDKAMFLKTLSETMAKFDLTLLYYVIMDNHFHLVVRTGQSSLSDFMQTLQRTYTYRYNVRYSRTGTIYAGRFKSVHVGSDRQLKHLIYYLAYNPVVAGMVGSPEEYPWCTHQFIMDGIVSLVDGDRLLEHFGNDRLRAMASYRELILHGTKGVVSRNECPIMDKEEDVSFFLDKIMDDFPLSWQERQWLRSGEGCPESLFELRGFLIIEMHDLGYSFHEIALYLSMDYFKIRKIFSDK